MTFKLKRSAVACCMCVLSAVLSAPTAAQVPDVPGWELLWHDEFDSTRLDADHWEALDRKDSYNNEKQYYLPGQVSVHDGRLRLTATSEPIDGKLYRSGLVRTWEEDIYGRWEVRAKLPSTQGMWPAIWLLPRDAPWPTGGEIDIMENRGNEPEVVSCSYHWGQDIPGHRFVFNEHGANNSNGPVDFQSGFHNYAVEWEPNEVRYYLDSDLVFTLSDDRAPISNTPMSLIINLAVGGDIGGDPDETTVFPQEFVIEYVRVWERKEGGANEQN